MNETPTGDHDHGLTRRRVVRVGATTVWAVPAIALATAAPALAASGAPSVTASGVTCNLGGAAESRTIGATFTNANTQATTALSVTFTFDPQVGTVDAQTAVPSAGWTVVTGVPRNLREVSFTRQDPQLTGSGGSMPAASITFTMYAAPAGPASNLLAGTIVVTPNPAPGTGTPGAGALS